MEDIAFNIKIMKVIYYHFSCIFTEHRLVVVINTNVTD